MGAQGDIGSDGWDRTNLCLVRRFLQIPEDQMPIMAAHGLNDARGAARLLAKNARECIHNPAIAPDRQVILNNVFRLLEAYRADPFFGLERSTKHPSGSSRKLSLLPPAERHVEEVRDVFERAIATTFAGEPKEGAIRLIEDVLRSVTYPEQFTLPSEQDKQRAAYFFDEVVKNLQLA
jgi:hypothetical protein